MIDTETEALLQNIDWQIQTNLMNQVSGSYSPALNDTLIAARVMLRSQAAEIDSLRSEVLLKAGYGRTTNAAYESCISERDQLKAKNEALVEALEELMGWQVKNVAVWSNSAYDRASRALKENT